MKQYKTSGKNAIGTVAQIKSFYKSIKSRLPLGTPAPAWE